MKRLILTSIMMLAASMSFAGGIQVLAAMEQELH